MFKILEEPCVENESSRNEKHSSSKKSKLEEEKDLLEDVGESEVEGVINNRVRSFMINEIDSPFKERKRKPLSFNTPNKIRFLAFHKNSGDY